MTELLEQAIAKLKTRPISEQDSIAINKDYRAVGQLDEDSIIWFWVGSHTEYDLLLDKF